VDQATQQAQQQAQQQGNYLTKEDAERMVQSALSNFQQGQARNQSHAEAQRAEREASEQAIKEAGLELKKEEIDIRGNRTQIEFMKEHFYKPTLISMAQYLHEQGLNPSDPQFEQKRLAPIPPEIIREAAAIVLPRFKAMAQQRVAQDIEQTNKIPPATLGQGAGGRGGKNPKDMSRDELKAAAFASAKAKGTIRR
jgi:ATP-dependent protease HslVU (ClpYQ) ATPase subunit